MSKKIFATLVLAFAALFAFVGCSGDNYSFTALTDNPSANEEVRSNGGIYVEKGKYSYFVNGAEDGTGSNNFGDEHKGAIVRCLTADLTKSGRTVEVVVPKIVYAGNKDSAGFYIFGDRIYYTTTNNTKDANGNVQFTKMDFMSANINGTDTKLLATVDKNDIAYQVVQTGDSVYIFYTGTDTIKVNGEDKEVTALYQIDAQTKEVKMIDNDVVTYAYDREGGNTVAYAKQAERKTSASTGQEQDETTYNLLYKFVAGNEEPQLIKNGKGADIKQNCNMTVISVVNNVIYYSYTSTLLSTKYLAKYDTAEKTIVQTSQDYTNFIPFVEDNKDAIYCLDGSWIKKIVFNNGAIESQTLLCMPSSTSITLQKVVGNYVFYATSSSDDSTSVLYRIDCDQTNQTEAKVIYGTLSDTWGNYDFAVVGEGEDQTVAVFYFNWNESGKFANYLYMDVYQPKEDDDDAKITSKRIGKLTSGNAATAKESGDDAQAVESYTK